MPVSFLLLAAAIVAVWIPPSIAGGAAARWGWPGLLLLSLVAGLADGHVTLPGLVAVVLLGLAATAYSLADPGPRRTALAGVAALLASGMATHRFPGFEPLALAELQRDGLAPVIVRAHLDTGIAGLMLLACFTQRGASLPIVVRGLAIGFGVGVVTAAVVIGAVVLAGGVQFDPKLPAITGPWMAANLFVTCVFEEALFRGLLQDRLTTWLRPHRGGAWIALGVASVLFGVAHAGGGPVLVAAATAAGIGYGMAYRLTGRIEAPVMAHFTLNTIHFLGFTYPMT